MSRLRQKAVAVARGAGVLPALERVHYLMSLARSRVQNRSFLAQNPDFTVPPMWWMHDMYAHTNIRAYVDTGVSHAETISAVIEREFGDKAVAVADWGCGLGRVIRFLPARHRRFGFDCNAAAIDWCLAHVEGVEFEAHRALPPLSAAAGAFDFVYSISVLTHLSQSAGQLWMDEIRRVLKPGGVFFFTVHGAGQIRSLSAQERAEFALGKPIYRGKVQEGSRIYVAYHPERFLRETLFRDFEIVEGPVQVFGQEGWVLRKPAGQEGSR